MMRRANGLVMRSLRYGHVKLWKMFFYFYFYIIITAFNKLKIMLFGDHCIRREKLINVCNNPVPDKDLTAAQTIWDYMILNHTPRKSDIILVLGNHDVRTADYASNLFLDGKADWLMFSGKVGVLTRGKWRKTEAEIFRDIALNKGVPEERILLELQATNTGENVAFSYDVLEAKNLSENLKSIILVQMPHMERRVYATFMKQWPGDPTKLDVTVTSPPILLRKYPNPDVGSLRAVITVMMGCMYRLKVYPETGFQIYQHIPDVVWDSYLSLLRSGKYNGHIPL